MNSGFLRFLALLGTFSPFLLAFFGGFIAIWLFCSAIVLSPASHSTQLLSFEIEKDKGDMKTIAKNLEAKGFVKHWWGFWILSRLNAKAQENATKISYGEYMISPGMTPNEILQKFIQADLVYHDMLVPPGARVLELPAMMAKTTLVTEDEARNALNNKSLGVRLEVPMAKDGSLFEGYIAPETYRFSRPMKAEDMIETMVETGRKKYTKEMYNRAIDLGLKFDQILILASIIEKETGIASERATIASVFHNRLRIGMPLQTDPVVIYGIQNFNGNLTREDLSTPGPYNTYLNTGLPPTPICSPSLESVQAALHPETTDYLYFVAKGDGSGGHQFSSTYRDHLKAKDEYLKTLAAQKSAAVPPPTPPEAPPAQPPT